MRKLAVALAIALAAAALAGCTATSTPFFPGSGPVKDPPDRPGRTTGPVISATSAARLAPESVPPYFLALTDPTGTAGPANPQPLDITVRASLTGQALAVARPPGNPGTFTFVTPSISDGRTFLVGAQPWRPGRPGIGDSGQPVSFYLLRFDPASRHTSLTPLPVPTASLAHVAVLVSAALSPDGTRLGTAAVELGGRVLDVHVYPMPAGGSGQVWHVTGRIASDLWGARLSWSANDRALAVGLVFGTVRLLDTATPPGSAAVEDITLGIKDGYRCYYPVLMTSDGTRLICGAAAGYLDREATAAVPGRGGFAVYDVRTGDLTAVLGAEGTGRQADAQGKQTPVLIWASPRGTMLIGQPLLGPVSLFSNGHYQPVAWTGVQQAGQAGHPISPGLPGFNLRNARCGQRPDGTEVTDQWPSRRSAVGSR